MSSTNVYFIHLNRIGTSANYCVHLNKHLYAYVYMKYIYIYYTYRYIVV